jgi:methyl-accepting chemotaxis protein
VNGWLDTNLLALRYTANLTDIRSLDPARQNPILEQLNSGYKWSYLALTTDAAGKNIGRSDGKEQTDYSDRIYYRQIIQDGQDLGHQTLIGRTSGKPALVLAVPILDDGHRTGVVALASTLADITDAVAGSSVGDTGFAFLLDAQGKAVAHPKEELSNSLKDLTEHPAYRSLKRSGKDQVLTRYRDGDVDAIAVARKIGLGWVLVVQQDESEVFRAVRDADRYALYLVSGTVVMVLTLSLVVARRLTRPIVQLTDAADQLSRGVLDAKIEATDRRDEIGALARAVDRMGMSIKIATQRLRSKQAG